jgi:hypothetical protein
MRSLVIISLTLIVLATVQAAGYSQEGVKEGDPLSIYLRRSPEQNLTFLNLYKAFNSTVEDKNQYVLVLGPKRSGTDKMVAYLPTSDPDNSLKYRPNASVQAMYNFSVLGRAVKDAPESDYRLKVVVEIDYRRGDDFDADDSFSFIIEGPSDSKVHERSGPIDITAGDLKRMDPARGGRIRITITRDDNEVNAVTLYTGYRVLNCGLTLPMSRDRSEAGSSDGIGVFLVLAVVAIIAGAVAAYLAFDHFSGKKDKDKGKGRRR